MTSTRYLQRHYRGLFTQEFLYAVIFTSTVYWWLFLSLLVFGLIYITPWMFYISELQALSFRVIQFLNLLQCAASLMFSLPISIILFRIFLRPLCLPPIFKVKALTLFRWWITPATDRDYWKLYALGPSFSIPLKSQLLELIKNKNFRVSRFHVEYFVSLSRSTLEANDGFVYYGEYTPITLPYRDLILSDAYTKGFAVK